MTASNLKMNWKYIAGFYDGEGSLTPHGKFYRISIPQLSSQASVLHEIDEFLTKTGIVGTEVYYYHYHLWKNEKAIFNLRRQKSLYKFFLGVEPYLRVKARDARIVLNEFEGYKPRQQEPLSWQYVCGFFDAEGYIKCRLRESGKYQFEIKFYQNENRVLKEIQNFLKRRGILSTIQNHQWIEDQNCYSRVLCVTGAKSVFDLLSCMLPDLRVKSNQAFETINIFENCRVKALADLASGKSNRGNGLLAYI